ncbi:MAG: CBS domain-containing protein [Candidatus Pacearchaeota archaeon]|jgi:predicted transcriptional regulator
MEKRKFFGLLILIIFYLTGSNLAQDNFVNQTNINISEETNLSNNSIEKTTISSIEEKDSVKKENIFIKILSSISLLEIILIIIFIILLIDFFFFKTLKKYFFIKPFNFFRKSAKDIGSLKINKFINRNFYRLDSEDNLLDAIEFFASNNINSIVITKANRACGVLVKKDLLKLINNLSFDKLTKTKLKEVIKRDFLFGNPKDNLDKVFNQIIKTKNGIILFEENGLLIGVVDYFDILNALGRQNLIVDNFPITREIMNSNVINIDDNKNLNQLKELFIKENTEYAIVLKENRPMGIVTIKDILGSIYKNLDLNNIYISNVMSPRLVNLYPWTPIYDTLEKFLEKRFNQIPIIDEDKIIGIVSVMDIVKSYYKLLNELKNINENYDIQVE